MKWNETNLFFFFFFFFFLLFFFFVVKIYDITISVIINVKDSFEKILSWIVSTKENFYVVLKYWKTQFYKLIFYVFWQW